MTTKLTPDDLDFSFWDFDIAPMQTNIYGEHKIYLALLSNS